jgi:hypothetical protein
MFASKGEEMTGGWRKLHNEELLLAKYYYDQIAEDWMSRVCSMDRKEVEIVESFGTKA